VKEAYAKEHIQAGVKGWEFGGSGTKKPDDRGGRRNSSNKENSVRNRQPLGIYGVCLCVRGSVSGGTAKSVVDGSSEMLGSFLVARIYPRTLSSISSIHVLPSRPHRK